MFPYDYKTDNTCSQIISLDLDGNVAHNVSFMGGCNGNMEAIPILIEGWTVEQIEENWRASSVAAAPRPAPISWPKINIDRMNEIENCKKQDGTKAFKPKGYDIVFDNVGFAYNSDEPVLQHMSFTAKQGEVTALIDPAGGGKSTTAKLAARFWEADKGTITVDAFSAYQK